jgi:WS/DGAT/MGAT family acyltransferase
MSATERELHAGSRMTELEAMMWAAERDPVLSSAMGSLFVLDTAPDFERFTESMEQASRTLLRLRERVEEGMGIAPPRWIIDDSFDIANHVRFETLPAPGGERELLDLTASVFTEPFATDKPLWTFVAVKGSGSRRKDAVKGAIIMKLHHSVSDGIGALRLAEMYLDLERDPAPTGADVAEAPAAAPSKGRLVDSLDDVDHLLREQFSLARTAAAEVALWGADRARARSAIKAVTERSSSLISQMVGSDLGAPASPLWAQRSAERTVEVFDLPLETMQRAAAAQGGSINDAFVAGSVIAARDYHGARSLKPPSFNLSFIMSTRADDKAGGNAFAPVPFTVGTASDDTTQFDLVLQAMEDKRGDAAAMSDSMEFAAALANGLPSAVLSRTGRSRSARMDWGTSNLRGAPFSIYVAGGKILRMYPVGPTGGTAFNLTAMSYDGTMHFGLVIDSAAVQETTELRDLLKMAYLSMAEGGADGDRSGSTDV